MADKELIRGSVDAQKRPDISAGKIFDEREFWNGIIAPLYIPDAHSVVDILKRGSTPLIIEAHGVGKTRQLMPHVDMLARDYGYVTGRSLRENSTSGGGFPTFDYHSTDAVGHLQELGADEYYRELFGITPIDAKKLLALDEAGTLLPEYQTGLKPFETKHLTDASIETFFEFLNQHNISTIFVGPGETEEQREDIAERISQKVVRAGLRLERHRMKQRRIPVGIIREALTDLGCDESLIDFATTEENRTVQNPRLLEELISVIHFKGVRSVEQLKDFIVNVSDPNFIYKPRFYLGLLATKVGTSKQDLTRMLSNLGIDMDNPHLFENNPFGWTSPDDAPDFDDGF